MSLKIYVFMYMCLFLFDDCKIHKNEKETFIFFPKHFICISFSKASWCQKSLAIYMIQGFAAIHNFTK